MRQLTFVCKTPFNIFYRMALNKNVHHGFYLYKIGLGGKKSDNVFLFFTHSRSPIPDQYGSYARMSLFPLHKSRHGGFLDNANRFLLYNVCTKERTFKQFLSWFWWNTKTLLPLWQVAFGFSLNHGGVQWAEKGTLNAWSAHTKVNEEEHSHPAAFLWGGKTRVCACPRFTTSSIQGHYCSKFDHW